MRRMLLPLLGVAGLVVALIAWRGLRTQSAAPPPPGGERPAGGLRLARVDGRVPGASGSIEGRVLNPAARRRRAPRWC